jgi:hypothetical protein
MGLPSFNTQIVELSLMQSAWATQLDPILAQPLSKANKLTNISLVSGDNVINHKLGRKLQGWLVIGMHNSFVQLYDKQTTNNMNDLTLILNSSGTGLIDLLVF